MRTLKNIYFNLRCELDQTYEELDAYEDGSAPEFDIRLVMEHQEDVFDALELIHDLCKQKWIFLFPDFQGGYGIRR